MVHRLHTGIFLLLLSCTACGGAHVHAHSPNSDDVIVVQRREASVANHRLAAEEVLGMADMPKVLETSLDLAMESQIQANPALKPYEDVMRAFLEKHMSWEALREDFVDLYMQEFSQSELEDILAFYRTDTGRKSIKILPEVMKKGSDLGQQRVKDNMAELQASLAARERQLGGESHPAIVE